MGLADASSRLQTAFHQTRRQSLSSLSLQGAQQIAPEALNGFCTETQQLAEHSGCNFSTDCKQQSFRWLSAPYLPLAGHSTWPSVQSKVCGETRNKGLQHRGCTGEGVPSAAILCSTARPRGCCPGGQNTQGVPLVALLSPPYTHFLWAFCPKLHYSGVWS